MLIQQCLIVERSFVNFRERKKTPLKQKYFGNRTCALKIIQAYFVDFEIRIWNYFDIYGNRKYALRHRIFSGETKFFVSIMSHIAEFKFDLCNVDKVILRVLFGHNVGKKKRVGARSCYRT